MGRTIAHPRSHPDLQALDASAPNAVNGQLVKLSAHLKVSSVYTSLAQSAERSYPQKILMDSDNACTAARHLFRMPLPPHDDEQCAQETGFRIDMAFAALRFLNDRYSHVVEQRNDVVKVKDWANIIKREGRVEDGAIAIARAADASVEAASIYHELDRIADLVRDRMAAIEARETSLSPEQGVHAELRSPPTAAPREAEKTVTEQSESEDNRFSLQEHADFQMSLPSSLDDARPQGALARAASSDAEPTVMLPGGQPDNRYSLLEAASRVALDEFKDSPGGAQETANMPSALMQGRAQGKNPNQERMGVEAELAHAARLDHALSASMDVPEERALTHSLAFGSLASRADDPDLMVGEMSAAKSAAVASTAKGEQEPHTVPVALRAMHEVLFSDLGFSGNRDDYYDPSNSLIHTVLANRTGNPITLSVVYLAIARRVGVHLTGAECPSHFIVRGQNDAGDAFFVDVFDRGKIMTLESCKAMFLTARSSLLDKKDLSPVTPVQIYSRIMRNLVNSHMILGNGDKALLWTERLRVLEQANVSAQGIEATAAVEKPKGWRGKALPH